MAIIRLFLVCVGASFVVLPVVAQVEGSWLGTLNAGVELRVVFHIERAGDGSLSATMDSPDQGATGIPVSGVSVSGDSVRIDVAVASGRYEGVMAADGSRIDGTWHQGGAMLALTLEPTGEVAPPERPQEPQPPFPYMAEDVTITTEHDGVVLAGTLTRPEGHGPFPAVILVSGSGPQNRDEELLGHKPFLVLADYLTRLGLAVLRYDDRGVAESTGNFGSATSEDFASDASDAVDFLKSRPDIAEVGIMGHSEGGLIAPMVASSRDDLAFIVLLAGPGATGEEILYRQGEEIARANGAPEAAIAQQRATQQLIYKILREEPDSAQAAPRLRDAILMAAAGQEIPEEAINGQIRQATSPWMRFFLTHDPLPALRAVKCPVLAVFGEKDLQVPPAQSIEPIRSALSENPDFAVVELKGLNHLFQTATTGSPSEYAQISETFSPTALAVVGDWLVQRVRVR